MKLAIYGYGHTVLKNKSHKVKPNHPHLKELIQNMWETMEAAEGCGLAAPQIGKSLQLFVADSKIIYDSLSQENKTLYFKEGDHGVRDVFMNMEIMHHSSNQMWEETEGCLSLPSISGKVIRPWEITVRYQNQKFETITQTFSGMTARVILHEYDHTQGILYTDRIKGLGKKLLEFKLKKIQNGNIVPPHQMKFK
ncbi:MAG: peptide deformylase [Weeksellaceae bacterium]